MTENQKIFLEVYSNLTETAVEDLMSMILNANIHEAVNDFPELLDKVLKSGFDLEVFKKESKELEERLINKWTK